MLGISRSVDQSDSNFATELAQLAYQVGSFGRAFQLNEITFAKFPPSGRIMSETAP
jgi:hypothetical protein